MPSGRFSEALAVYVALTAKAPECVTLPRMASDASRMSSLERITRSVQLVTVVAALPEFRTVQETEMGSLLSPVAGALTVVTVRSAYGIAMSIGARVDRLLFSPWNSG